MAFTEDLNFWSEFRSKKRGYGATRFLKESNFQTELGACCL